MCGRATTEEWSGIYCSKACWVADYNDAVAGQKLIEGLFRDDAG